MQQSMSEDMHLIKFYGVFVIAIAEFPKFFDIY